MDGEVGDGVAIAVGIVCLEELVEGRCEIRHWRCSRIRSSTGQILGEAQSKTCHVLYFTSGDWSFAWQPTAL